MTPKKNYSKKRSKTEYVLFLRSNYWKRVRKKVLQRDNYTCTQCGRHKQLQVHHLTYEHHNFEHLYLGDLTTLCNKCHELLHKIKNKVKLSTK